MKKVYFKPPASPDYYKNRLFRIKSIHNVYWNIDKKFKSVGIDFNTIDLYKTGDGDIYIYSDVPYLTTLRYISRSLLTQQN